MNNRLGSFNSALNEISELSDEQLYLWLIQVLDRRVPDAKRLPTRWMGHAFVSRLYRKSDLLLRARISRAYASLFLSFEPGLESTREPSPGECEYLFNLVSLASTIRTEQVKARLQRWLYLETYRKWEHDIFNLHNEILLATSAYDPDEAWLSHIYETLPAKPYFSKFALASYRAVLQTQGIACVRLLPHILSAVDPQHEKKRRSFGYLLRVTMRRFDPQVFLGKAAAALNAAGQDVAEVCSNCLRLEDFLRDAFEDSQREQFRRCVEHFRREVLDPAIRKLHEMDEEEKVEALHLLVEKKQPKILYSAVDVGPSCVLAFSEKYEIGINDETAASLLPRLNDYEWINPLSNDSFTVGRPLVRAAAAGGGFGDKEG